MRLTQLLILHILAISGYFLYIDNDFFIKNGFFDVMITKTKLHLQETNSIAVYHINIIREHVMESVIHYISLNFSLHQCQSNQISDIHQRYTVIVGMHVIFLFLAF